MRGCRSEVSLGKSAGGEGVHVHSVIATAGQGFVPRTWSITSSRGIAETIRAAPAIALPSVLYAGVIESLRPTSSHTERRRLRCGLRV